MYQLMERLFSIRVKRLSSEKRVTVTADYKSDLSLVMFWLKLNGAASPGKIRKTKKGYAASVVAKKSKSAIRDLVKDRFGVFANVV